MAIINLNPIAFGCILVGMALIPAIVGSFLYPKHKLVAIILYVISTIATFFICEVLLNDSHNNVQDWGLGLQIAIHGTAILVTLCCFLILLAGSLVAEKE